RGPAPAAGGARLRLPGVGRAGKPAPARTDVQAGRTAEDAMTASRHEVRMAVSALVALTLVRCSDEAGPTGWIPQNGTISGVITVTGAFPLPPAGAVRSSVGGTA